MNFLELFDPMQGCVKSPVIPAPFRRTLFEPIELPWKSRTQPAPEIEEQIEDDRERGLIVDSYGNEYIRISDVKHLIEPDLREAERRIHEEAIDKFKSFLEEWEKRRVALQTVKQEENIKPPAASEHPQEDEEPEETAEPEEPEPVESAEPDSCHLWF